MMSVNKMQLNEGDLSMFKAEDTFWYRGIVTKVKYGNQLYLH